MKKYIAIFLFTLFAFTTVACGSGSSTDSSNSDSVGKFFGSKKYSVESGKILWQGNEIEGVSPFDFKVIAEDDDGNDYAITSKAVYNMNELVPGMSPKGFMILDQENNILKNNEHVYVSGEVLDGVDAMSYKLLGDYMAADKNGVYSSFSEKWGDVADPLTFEVIPYSGGNTYGKDSKHVYMDGEIVEGADPKTFKPDTK